MYIIENVTYAEIVALLVDETDIQPQEINNLLMNSTTQEIQSFLDSSTDMTQSEIDIIVSVLEDVTPEGRRSLWTTWNDFGEVATNTYRVRGMHLNCTSE